MPLTLLSPVAIFVAIDYQDYLRPQTLMLILESSFQNQVDILGQYLVPLLLGLGTSLYLHHRLVCMLPKNIPFKQASLITLIGLGLVYITPLLRYGTTHYKAALVTQNSHFYPFYLKSGIIRGKKEV